MSFTYFCHSTCNIICITFLYHHKICTHLCYEIHISSSILISPLSLISVYKSVKSWFHVKNPRDEEKVFWKENKIIMAFILGIRTNSGCFLSLVLLGFVIFCGVGISVMKYSALDQIIPWHWIPMMSIYNFIVQCIPIITEKIYCYPDINIPLTLNKYYLFWKLKDFIMCVRFSYLILIIVILSWNKIYATMTLLNQCFKNVSKYLSEKYVFVLLTAATFIREQWLGKDQHEPFSCGTYLDISKLQCT